MIVLLWQISLILSVITLLYGLFGRSRLSLLISFITSIPIAYYFLGAENSWRLVALAPIVILMLAFVLWRNKAQ
jgi:phosphoglycerol transferase MdoB-like AlkP superfamily enzyme